MKLLKIMFQPWRLIASTKLTKFTKWVPDRLYLKCLYKTNLGLDLDLKNVATYNEKLQWLKLNDRCPRYTQMVDKAKAKEYVGNIIGEEHIVKVYGIWGRFEDIDFSALPNQFVLKCTHDSAGLVICKDKTRLDLKSARKKLNKCLKRNFYYSGREWPYKNVLPQIIAEEYLEDSTCKELRDYKFFTFHGHPQIVHIVSNRGNANEETYGDFFDMDYNHLDLTMGHPNAPCCPEMPRNFEKMKEFAAILAEGTIHLRVDFYEVDGHLYFGELTFYQDSGFADIQPERWNKILGDWINIPVQ